MYLYNSLPIANILYVHIISDITDLYFAQDCPDPSCFAQDNPGIVHANPCFARNICITQPESSVAMCVVIIA